MRKQPFSIAWTLPRFDAMSPELLIANNIRLVLSDLDDTLVPHGQRTSTPELCKWLDAMTHAGITVCLISNNRYARTAEFANPLHLAFFCNAMKPSVHALQRVCDAFNVPKEQAVFLGDQLLTDIRAGQRFGVRCALVTPLTNGGGFFVRLKRRWERFRYKRPDAPLSPETHINKKGR